MTTHQADLAGVTKPAFFWTHDDVVKMSARLGQLEAENARLRAALDRQALWPEDWRLAPQERRLLSALAAGPFCPIEAAVVAAYGPGTAVTKTRINTLYVVFFRMRKRLKPFSIEIETLRGEGWALTEASRPIVDAARGPTQ